MEDYKELIERLYQHHTTLTEENAKLRAELEREKEYTAAYKDTGLEPEEIVAAANRRHDCKIDCLLKKYNELYDAVADLGGIDHIRELVQAEKDGLPEPPEEG